MTVFSTLSSKTDSEKIISHKEFLKSAIDEENNRLSLIENKTSQIISQTSIVFSLLGLFMPIIIDKTGETNIYIKVAIIFLVLIAFIFYLLTINNALKNFNINKFSYSVPTPENVLTLQNNTVEEFNSELIRDYLYCINKNIVTNNRKATNLLHSHNTFKFANLITGLIVVFLSVMILFSKNDDPKIHIEKAVKIDKLDSIIRTIKPIFIIQQDTVVVRDTIYLKNNKIK
ncbi:hypothetical protein H9X57_11290 [Flavobacterium piscinae]|uniref:Uncharacterized protein n=1 Tax=Flavobacterium piscinae TaxID=2506424 RepID=A0A4Q1KTL0_9FLAO|nr:hypothetical protein [Flavobacterium piscinae]MBC8883733.1 hypothetical protein [Flavobacterium piscinae]RXR33533.1 hypothetical protein EQG68_04715 [Flavobacterium piscinae]